MKFESGKVENHFSQSVYSLVITYQQRSRSHKHSFIFVITDDRSLVKEVNKYLNYSKSHLINVYPWLDDIELVAYEVSKIPPMKYRISPVTGSFSGFLHETISVTPCDVCSCDFSFRFSDDDSDDSYDLPF